jgi:hypothetical protein
MNWKVIKIVVAVFLSLGALDLSFQGTDDANGFGLMILLLAGFLVLFQAMLWIGYDVITLRKGIWKLPGLRSSPFRMSMVMDTSFFSLIFGFSAVAQVVGSPFFGVERLISGAWLLLAAALMAGSQLLLLRLFAERFRARL